MDDYLAKPITLVELRHKLEKWLPHGGTVWRRQWRWRWHRRSRAKMADEPGNRVRPCAAARSDAVDRRATGPERSTSCAKSWATRCRMRSAPSWKTRRTYLAELEKPYAGRRHPPPRAARAHALKGSAGNLGANRWRQLAQQAEQLAIAGQVDS
jgi:hypothetical protein